MYGWWSYDYLLNINIYTPIYIYSTELNSNVMILAITDSLDKLPNIEYNWICMGKINNLIKTINCNNLLDCGNESNCVKYNLDEK